MQSFYIIVPVEKQVCSRNINLKQKRMLSRVSKQIWVQLVVMRTATFAFQNCFVSYHPKEQLFSFLRINSLRGNYLKKKNFCQQTLATPVFSLPFLSFTVNKVFILMFCGFHNLSEEKATFLQQFKNHFWAVRYQMENSEVSKNGKFNHRLP